MSSVQPLPPVPGTPFRALDYTANRGAWEGGLHEVRWGYEKGWLRSQVRRALIRRRWFQVSLVQGDLTVVLWIRDEGTSGAARMFVTRRNRKGGEVLAHRDGRGRPLSTLSVGPFACNGTDAWLRSADCDISLSRPIDGDAWELSARFDGLHLEATLADSGAPPSTVIGEHGRRRPGLTSKFNLLQVTGRLVLGPETHDLDGGLGVVAYTNGFFPRDARWLEVTALGTLPDGRRIGLGFDDGSRHGSEHEHVLWLDGALYQTPRIRILVGGRVSRDTWRLRSPHGDLELKLRPSGADVETASRLLGSIRTERVTGTLTGRIPMPDGTQLTLTDLPAIAEDHTPVR